MRGRGLQAREASDGESQGLKGVGWRTTKGVGRTAPLALTTRASGERRLRRRAS
jgi:hypothetical protein